MINDNHRVVDLRKVQWASRCYVNQFGETVHKRPSKYSIHGVSISPNEPALYHPSFPDESCKQRASRLGILDRWIFVCHVKLSAGRCLTYSGQKAISIYRDWNRRIFGRRK